METRTSITISKEQADTIRAALIAARLHYCHDQCEHGGDGMKAPEPDIKAAMETLGMRWQGDLSEIFHGDAWTGNEHFKPTNQQA